MTDAKGGQEDHAASPRFFRYSKENRSRKRQSISGGPTDFLDLPPSLMIIEYLCMAVASGGAGEALAPSFWPNN